jgi:hypothetical protein
MFMVMFVSMVVAVSVAVTLTSDSNRSLARQTASAIFTHYSISREASSNSRPARSSRLGVWQSGQAANILSAWNSFWQAPHQKRAGMNSRSNRAPSAIVPGASASNANCNASGTTPLRAPMRIRMAKTLVAPAWRACSSAIASAPSMMEISCKEARGYSPAFSSARLPASLSRWNKPLLLFPTNSSLAIMSLTLFSSSTCSSRNHFRKESVG